MACQMLAPKVTTTEARHLGAQHAIVLAGIPSAATYLHVARLRHLPACVRLPIPEIWALAHWEGEWLALVRSSVQWLWELVDRGQSFSTWRKGKTWTTLRRNLESVGFASAFLDFPFLCPPAATGPRDLRPRFLLCSLRVMSVDSLSSCGVWAYGHASYHRDLLGMISHSSRAYLGFGRRETMIASPYGSARGTRLLLVSPILMKMQARKAAWNRPNARKKSIMQSIRVSVCMCVYVYIYIYICSIHCTCNI